MADLERDSPSDREILRCVEATVHDVLLPSIPADESWARTVAVQLVGLVRYALRRGEDAAAERTAELFGVLSALAGNEIVDAVWDGDGSHRSVMRAAGAALAAAVARDDAAGDEIRAVLRPVVVRQLDDELASTASLVAAFRGRLDG